MPRMPLRSLLPGDAFRSAWDRFAADRKLGCFGAFSATISANWRGSRVLAVAGAGNRGDTAAAGEEAASEGEFVFDTAGLGDAAAETMSRLPPLRLPLLLVLPGKALPWIVLPPTGLAETADAAVLAAGLTSSSSRTKTAPEGK